MNNLKKFKDINKNFLTFYHECLIPKNNFFRSESNKDFKSNLLFISSPSRMGNHALLSMLDNHPQLPRIPGEDSFLRHCFFLSTYDLHCFIKNIKVRIIQSLLEIYQVFQLIQTNGLNL